MLPPFDITGESCQSYRHEKANPEGSRMLALPQPVSAVAVNAAILFEAMSLPARTHRSDAQLPDVRKRVLSKDEIATGMLDGLCVQAEAGRARGMRPMRNGLSATGDEVLFAALCSRCPVEDPSRGLPSMRSAAS